MTNSETKNWPDLSSFGAELKIWRGNAHPPLSLFVRKKRWG